MSNTQRAGVYPFQTPTGIVRNRWYIAAFSNEITREPIERTFLGTPVALYRKLDGDPVAMYGICPHRYAPLAKGRLEGDALACGYHGFVFEADGWCSNIPSQSTPAKFCQPTYPIVERGPLCWIWMGDKDKADPARIPPYADFGLGEEGWHYSSENYFHIKGRAQLLIDNLMDLTHLPYVHHHVPGGEAMKAPQIVDEERDISYRVSRYAKSPFTPFHAHVFGPHTKFEGLSDFLALSDYYGPEFIRTSLPITIKLDNGQPVPEGLGSLFILHGITPETENTTHYFGFSTRNFRLGDASLDKMQQESDIKIRAQDVIAIEDVERRLEVSAALQREFLVRSDRPAIKVRKMIEAMLVQEATDATSPSP